MSSRLTQALAAGRVVLLNRGGTEVAVTLVHLLPNPANPRRPIHARTVVTLKPGKPVDLTEDFTVAELRASLAPTNGLTACVKNRPVDVLDTWSA